MISAGLTVFLPTVNPRMVTSHTGAPCQLTCSAATMDTMTSHPRATLEPSLQQLDTSQARESSAGDNTHVVAPLPTVASSHEAERTIEEDGVLMTRPAVARFGSFRLNYAERLLVEGARPVPLGARTLDLLIALVENAGEIVSKKQLLARAWPHTVVAEGALRVHISALRKALGDSPCSPRFIASIPGRGYSFVAAVLNADAQARGPADAVRPTQHNLPNRLTRMLGRAEAVEPIAALLDERRLVTLVGPGGIGKTTTALAVAERCLPNFSDGVRFVDLSTIRDSGEVVLSIANGIGVDLATLVPREGLVAQVRDLKMLVVIDNCEHVNNAVALAATGLLKGARGLRILATSREPLCVECETVSRLASLPTPPSDFTMMTAEQARRYLAVELLVERAGEWQAGFQLSDTDAEIAAEVCRRLDGIPLAIELAAARIGFFGLRGLRDRIKDNLRVLCGSTRMGLSRHQSLRALLDWSFDLLSPASQVVFRRLAVFSGCFTLEAATTVASGAGVDPDVVVDQVIDLAQKSMVVARACGEAMHYRLLDTTRVYASERLLESKEVDRVFERHANWLSTGLSSVAPLCGHVPRVRYQECDAMWTTAPHALRRLRLDCIEHPEQRAC